MATATTKNGEKTAEKSVTKLDNGIIITIENGNVEIDYKGTHVTVLACSNYVDVSMHPNNAKDEFTVFATSDIYGARVLDVEAEYNEIKSPVFRDTIKYVTIKTVDVREDE